MTNSEPIQSVSLDATHEMWNEWRQYLLKSFGIQITEESLASFSIFLAELKDWNEKINLVSFRSDREVLFRHFADSIAGLKLINTLGGHGKSRIIDIGTGAGFPGIPVYLASGFHDITLVESITKKTSFLAHLQDKLKLEGIKIINDRAENLGQNKLYPVRKSETTKDNINCDNGTASGSQSLQSSNNLTFSNGAHRASYDFVLSRAVSKLSPNLEVALPLLKKGGYALIYKTEKSSSDEEMKTALNALKELNGDISERFCYTIPYESLNYCIVAFRKNGDTPAAYPRRAGMPEKKPL